VPERDSIGRTLFVAGAVALICSLIVSSAVTWLRPIQLAYRAVDQSRVVLVAAGLISEAAAQDQAELVASFLELEQRLVDLDAGEYVNADANMVAAYDFRDAAVDPAASREIASALDIASLGRRPLVMPVYIRRDNGGIDRIVLPVYGQGMWSTIHAYLVLDGSLTRVVRLEIAEHGETPGIGDRIGNPDWLAGWVGKRAFRDDGAPVLRIGGPAGGDPDERIDGITGATVTVEALDSLVRYWLGDDGYGPFLARLKGELGESG